MHSIFIIGIFIPTLGIFIGLLCGLNENLHQMQTILWTSVRHFISITFGPVSELQGSLRANLACFLTISREVSVYLFHKDIVKKTNEIFNLCNHCVMAGKTG